jgi:anti-sigma-K factor RskA
VLAAGVGVGTWTVANRDAADARRSAAEAQARTAAIADVLAAPDVRVLALPGRDGGTVNLAVARSRNKAVAVLKGLPVLQGDQVYQLWMIPPAGALEAVSQGVLAVGQTEDTRLIDVGDGVQFGVSIEPKGGSPRPHASQIIAAGQFST